MRTTPHDRTFQAVRYFISPYERAIETVERERDRLFEVVRRAWANPTPDETARRIGAAAHISGLSFDEVLFWLWEQVALHGSGSIWLDGSALLVPKPCKQ